MSGMIVDPRKMMALRNDIFKAGVGTTIGNIDAIAGLGEAFEMLVDAVESRPNYPVISKANEAEKRWSECQSKLSPVEGVACTMKFVQDLKQIAAEAKTKK